MRSVTSKPAVSRVLPMLVLALLVALWLAAVPFRRPEEALQLLERASEADPGHAETWYLFGKIYSEQGRREEAAAAMRRFLELWKFEGEQAEAARRIISEGTR